MLNISLSKFKTQYLRKKNQVLYYSIKTDGEKEIPYSKATKKLILEYPLLANTLVEIYFAELTKQKAKN